MPGRVTFEVTDFAPDLYVGNEAAAFHQILDQAVHFRNCISMDFSHVVLPKGMGRFFSLLRFVKATESSIFSFSLPPRIGRAA